MFCKNCGSQLDEDARFCTKCGNKVENDLNAKFCVHCGSKLDDDSVFCTKCGSRVKDEINVSDEEKTMPESNDSAESVEVELIPCETNQQEKNEQELVVSQSIEETWQEALKIPEEQHVSDVAILENENVNKSLCESWQHENIKSAKHTKKNGKLFIAFSIVLLSSIIIVPILVLIWSFC